MCCTLKPIFIVWKVPGVNFYYLLSTRGAHSCSRKCPARPATGFRASSKPLMTYSRATCKIKLPEAPENRLGFKCRAATYLVHSVVLIRGITGSAPTCCTPHTVLPVSPSAAQICHTVEVVESASAKKPIKHAISLPLLDEVVVQPFSSIYTPKGMALRYTGYADAIKFLFLVLYPIAILEYLLGLVAGTKLVYGRDENSYRTRSSRSKY